MNAEVEYITKSTGGGSDSNIYNEKGYKALTIAVGMTKFIQRRVYRDRRYGKNSKISCRSIKGNSIKCFIKIKILIVLREEKYI